MKCADLPGRLFQVLPTASHRRPRRHRPAFESFEDKLLLSTYYVATTGSDSSGGTATAPWATFQKAVSTAKAGDTVQFAPGTYNSAQVNFNNSGTASAPITFVSTVQWGAQFRWASSQSANHVGLDVAGNYVTIQGFDVSATSNNTDEMVGIQLQGLHDSVIGNRVHDFISGDVPGAGIADEYTSANQYTNIIGNWVYDIGTTANEESQGIYPQNYGDVVQNNVVYNCAAWGIQAYHTATNTTIANNLVFGNKAGGILCESAPTSDGNTSAVHFSNSIISNNIVYDNGGYGISNSSSALIGSGNQYLNNFVYGNAAGGFSLEGNSSYIETGNITTNPNPGFVNYQANGTGNYHLAPGSPCIGTGTSQGAPATDINGVSRPQGGPYDIGPYEFTSSNTTPPTDVVPPVVITSAQIEVVGRQRVIVLQLSGPVNSATADKLASYQLTQRRKGVQLVLATYNPANNTIRLKTRLALPPKLRYPFTVTLVGLKDAHGNPVGGTFSIA